ncbi:lactate utilization protein [Neptunomonas sp. XY-337]|uniref:LutC/YkgG family protein n=1 Tax=Neptunomonas sp. XY-337 TaxID=2561897 RepID=UPI0010AAB1CA|nr:lactate utilization protein [Neptunomonas sp. XY-337]
MSRAEIFSNIRRGLGRGEASAAQKAAVKARLDQHKANLIPMRAQLPHHEQVALFKEMALEAAAEIIELTDIHEVPAACETWLANREINELIAASDSQITALDWQSTSRIQLNHRVGKVGDIASLTTSFAGIAETGTLMLYSRQESPTTLNFLPDVHMVILHEKDIVGPYEDAWQKLRSSTAGTMPRTVNMITGPSRSADIEQRLQMGAHGPKELVILLISDSQ